MRTTQGSAPLADRARQQTARTVLRAGSSVKRFVTTTLLGEKPAPPLDPPLEDLGPYPVVAYFAETPVRSYQLRQWLPVLEQVAADLPVLVATRSWSTTHLLREVTTLPVAYAHTLDGLLHVYDHVDVKTVVYVNNGMRNFQSLIYRRALHVHVNHGESDKISMVSNQAKAYDHVVVAGAAAVERHRRALINFDLDRLVVCGRPQLDLDVEQSVAPVAGLHTVLYAPTWSGEDDANNYTSLDRYGVQIVRALLARPDVRVVYKPHPRVLTTPDEGVAHGHAEIVRLLTEADRGRPEPRHLQPFDADILSTFDAADLLITDISSVGLDFLYLRPDVPILLTDRRTERARLLDEAPIARATDVVDAGTVDDVAATIHANLTSDPRRTVRQEMRDHYFGFARGESSTRFLELLLQCTRERDAMVDAVRPAQASADTGGDPALEGIDPTA